VPELKKGAGAEGKLYGVEGPFVLIDFDFALFRQRDDVQSTEVERVRAGA
jgi:catechol 1,2-dioxygenase